jgi:hypothetical protein
MFIRTPYNYDVNEASIVTGVECVEPTLARQEFKNDSDLNTMIRRFGVEVAQAPNWREFDATVIPDNFMELQQILKEGVDAFNSLPSDVRAKHENNPEKFLNWVKDEQTRLAKADREAAKAAKEFVETPVSTEAQDVTE